MRFLNELNPCERGTICKVNGTGALRRRLLDMGVVPGAEIEVIRVAPLGDPVEYKVKGYRLSLRRSEAANVLVEELPCEQCHKRRNCRNRSGRRRRGRRRWLAWMAGSQDVVDQVPNNSEDGQEFVGMGVDEADGHEA
ncbi:MAG: ferrous iron transport protein A [Chloroflexota bacterium]|nr:ferrous iron transport protein A [Chloroflexota bacterium]